jgi:hypothetical protein
VSIDVNHSRPDPARPGQCHAKEEFGGSQIPLGRQKEVDGAGGINCPIEVRPIPGNLDIRLIHPPQAIQPPQLAAKPLIQNGCIALDPAPDGDVVNRGDAVPIVRALAQRATMMRIDQYLATRKDLSASGSRCGRIVATLTVAQNRVVRQIHLAAWQRHSPSAITPDAG